MAYGISSKKNSKEMLYELLKKAKLGDSKAKTELITNFRPLVIKLSKEVYIKDYDIDDLIQIGTISLLKAIENYNLSSKTQFSSYAYTAIKNNFSYEIRKKINSNWEISLNAPNEEGFTIMDNLPSNYNIEENFLNKLKVQALKEAILKLKPLERDLIIEVYLKGTSIKEYAKSRGIVYSTCTKRKVLILKKLKKALETEI